MGLIPLEERKIPPERVDFVASAYGSQKPRLGWPVSELVADLEADARAAGFKAPQFRIISGYRDIATQERLWQQALAAANGDVSLARKTTAPPGNSSHHSGFAFDIFLGVGGTKMSKAPEIFNSREYKFMRDVLGPRYNLTQLSNEPWHWECDAACRDSYLLSKYGSVQVSPDDAEPAIAALSDIDTVDGAEPQTSKLGKYMLVGAAGLLACTGVWLAVRKRS